MGKNSGKKYIKLTGFEVPTAENEARAIDFMAWYGREFEQIKRNLQGNGGVLDEDVLGDTFLRVYASIALKGLDVKNYMSCFLSSYRNTLINAYAQRHSAKQVTDSLDENDYIQRLDVPTNDREDVYVTEIYIERVETEVLEYVRANYDPIAVSLFEIYVALKPDISYKRLADMLGYPANKVWPVIGPIKKAVVSHFAEYHTQLKTLFS